MKIDKIIEDLYEGTLDPLAWDRAILSIADSVRASGAMLFAFNPSNGVVLRDENHRVDPQASRDYARHWSREDVRIAHFLSMPTGQAGTEVTLAIPLKETAIYNEFLVPVDTPYFMPAWLHKSRTKVVALSLQGGRKRGPFGSQDIERFNRIIPHLARALEIRDRLESAQVRATNLANILDNASFGVIVLDENRKILETNVVGSAVLMEESGLHRGRDGTLVIKEPRSTLAKRMLGGNVPDGIADSLIHLSRPGKLPLSILVIPIPKEHTFWLSGNPAWIFLVFDGERRLPLNKEVIRRDLGLSAREAQVASLLAAGFSVPHIARRMHVTVHTVRTQLQSAFEKTGCHSQGDLIRRLLQGPGMFR
jgi:DNA-binding CsgD family transcriptional regulator